MNALELEIVCERDQRCVRRVEFLASHSLWDVHRCIQREFDLDNDHVWSFYLSGEYHDPDTEFGGTPLDGGTAAKARLGELDLEEGMSIAYVFDFGDELRHQLRVVRIAEREAGVEYPRVIFRAGTPPPQYRFRKTEPEDDEIDDDESEAPELEAAESDAGPEEVAPSVPEARSVPDQASSFPADLVEKVRKAMDLAHEPDDEEVDESGFEGGDLATVASVFETCETEERLVALCDTVGRDVFHWIATVLARGISAGRAEEVEPLAGRLARTAPDTRHQFLWATGLLRMNRRDEALAVMASYQPVGRPESIRHRIRSAMLLADGGDDAAAEGQLRALLGLRWLSRDAREETSRALAPILRRTKRGAEATSMLDELAAKRMARLLRKPLPARRIAPKVGRNDPCPCGSGRKYKKCCGLGR